MRHKLWIKMIEKDHVCYNELEILELSPSVGLVTAIKTCPTCRDDNGVVVGTVVQAASGYTWAKAATVVGKGSETAMSPFAVIPLSFIVAELLRSAVRAIETGKTHDLEVFVTDHFDMDE